MTLAGKSFDTVVGVDTHIVLMPTPVGAPIPVPLPNPYVGILMDPLDWLPVVGATVQIGGLPRAQAGSKCLQISPHVPLGGPLAPLPTGEAEVFMGSATVCVDGDAQSYLGLPVLSCQSVGMPAPPRTKGAPSKSLVLPTSALLALPLSSPVLIGGAPTISLLGLAQQAGIAGLGKMLRKAQRSAGKLAGAVRAAARKADTAGKALVKRLALGDVARNRIARAACTVTGHPVDVATGKVFTDRVDLKLPGPLPLELERVWYSSSTYRGPLGHGWHHSYDAALYLADDCVLFRAQDGRMLAFPSLARGQSHVMASERLTLLRDEHGYSIRTGQRDLLVFRAVGRSTGEHALVAIEDAVGHSIQLRHDERGLLTQIEDSAGRHLELEYDAAQRLVALRTPHPNERASSVLVRRYAYDERGDLCRATDALDQSEVYEYRGHLLVRETDRNGLSFYFQYDGEDHTARCTHTWGDGGIYDHRLVYDAERWITTVTNSLGHATQHEHRDGLVIRSVDPHGGVTSCEYDQEYRLLAQADALGHVTRFSYDARGNTLTVTQPDGARWQLDYDRHDQLIAAIDTLGGRWQFEYDVQGRSVARIDPLGHRLAYVYRGKLLAAVIDAAGQRTSVQFDEAGNLIEIERPNGAVEHFVYDRLGQLIVRRDALGQQRRYEYDVTGRTTRTHEPDGDVCELAYDPEGNVLRASRAQQDQRFSYCGLGRLASRTEAGTTVRFQYDTEERLIGVVNEHGQIFRFELDATGEVVAEHGWSGLRRRYQRDRAGRVSALERPSGVISRYRYDAAGRVTRIEHSDGSHEVYTYRADGQLMAAKNATTECQFVRDPLGRVLRELQAGQWVDSVYDARGLRVRMRSSLGADQQITRDALGAVIALAHEAGDRQASFEVQMTRDALGSELERSLPGGVRSRWLRDRSARPLRQELRTGGQLIRERGYRWQSPLQLQATTDSVFGAARFTHDARGSVVLAHHAAGTELRLPDAVGNLFRREDRRDREYGPTGELRYAIDARGRGQRYEYDAEGQLISKTSDASERWEYRWGPDGMLHTVVRPDGSLVTFVYDALGRRIRKHFRGQVTRWVWDGDVPLHEWVEAELQPSTSSASAQPSAAGISADKREAELSRQLLRGPPERGSLQRPITWLFEPETFTPLAKLIGDQRLAIITDQVGTPIAMLDPTGQQVWVAEIGLWGALREGSGDASSCPFRWPGQYEDLETGLYYNRFRYYDPEAGQYISQDPIGLAGGLALHGYVHDPLVWVDPLGLNCELSAKQQAAAIALAPLKAAFAGAKVGFRGSLARGKKGSHKGGGPFDPQCFDVDAFVVSDELANLVPSNKKGFRNLSRLSERRPLVEQLGAKVKAIPGVRPGDTFKVRVFSEQEFSRRVGIDERYIL